MIGSWPNRIIDQSRCHARDRHTFDTSNSDVNYVTLALAHQLRATGWIKMSHGSGL